MYIYRLYVTLSFLGLTSSLVPMTVKQRWEHVPHATHRVMLKTTQKLPPTCVCPKEFGLPCNDTLYAKGDFTLDVNLETNRNFANTTSYTPSFLQKLCCIAPPEEEFLFQQEITLIDERIDERSYTERRFSGSMRPGSQALSGILATDGYKFEYSTYSASSKNDPTYAIIVAPNISMKNKKCIRSLVVFGFRPFNPLCTLACDIPKDIQIFVNSAGDAIMMYDIQTHTVTVFKLAPPTIIKDYLTIIKDYLHDTFFRFA